MLLVVAAVLRLPALLLLADTPLRASGRLIGCSLFLGVPTLTAGFRRVRDPERYRGAAADDAD